MVHSERTEALNIKAVASEIVRTVNEEKWQVTQEHIEKALKDAYEEGCGDKAEAYRLGFLDGEASIRENLRGTVREDLEALDVPEGCGV